MTVENLEFTKWMNEVRDIWPTSEFGDIDNCGLDFKRLFETQCFIPSDIIADYRSRLIENERDYARFAQWFSDNPMYYY
ncbi:hypothetical protein FDI40_gp158 [Agrobacterium phage Atu_ph07]|uniref:Uncharacterized protein n=1 Tax=Agrobacterium phage Atu_ph07 TaxID=2024264 RepID=A0A2L0UZJ9_9CAUD|nr:hypothetical protein FDI40_gp158 [Agrobacterium phage Atu_ph07]AUZ94940.1 hypothetical protein [Agrobacterium phage Atu_ph07]